MFRKALAGLFAASALAALSSAPAHAQLINGGFENTTPTVSANNFAEIPNGGVPPWVSKDSSDALVNFEIWRSVFKGITAYQGNNFAEIQSSAQSYIYQDVATVAGVPLSVQFAHRARGNINADCGASCSDTVRVKVIDNANSNVLYNQTFTTSNLAWVLYSFDNIVASGSSVRLQFIAEAFSSGNPTIGNFLDGVDVIPMAPGPLPLLGAGTAFAFSRRLRRRVASPQA